MHKCLSLLVLLICSSAMVMAQTPNDASVMESHGKIYVVMAVCLTVLVGLIIYLVMIDRKVTAIEKKKD